MSKPYVLDLTSKMQEWEQENAKTLETMSDIVKMFPKLYNKELRLEDDHTPNLDYNTLEVEHQLYVLYDKNGYYDYFLIEITHLYGGVVFYKYLEGPEEGVEKHMSSKCLLFEHWTFPTVVKILPGWEIESMCKRVEFIN